MIERNKHPAGRLSNIGFGLVSILDGLIRCLSLGFLHTRLPLNYSRCQVRAILGKAQSRQQTR